MTGEGWRKDGKRIRAIENSERLGQVRKKYRGKGKERKKKRK